MWTLRLKNLGGGVVKLSINKLSNSNETATVEGLKGYQNILAIWDKLKKGEIRKDEISAVLEYNDYIYHYTSMNVYVSPDGERRFQVYFTGEFFVTGAGFSNGIFVIMKYERKNIGIDSTECGLITFDGQKQDFTAVFTD